MLLPLPPSVPHPNTQGNPTAQMNPRAQQMNPHINLKAQIITPTPKGIPPNRSSDPNPQRNPPNRSSDPNPQRKPPNRSSDPNPHLNPQRNLILERLPRPTSLSLSLAPPPSSFRLQ
ncbi:hypothetical protein Pcinc_043730 [Petrolisthes cinctipes]|uniref:Uncharacterized protein n=1 Tax=Petrolisthes cinctipes TaxID=88211 RepID=A0AAE1BIL9_PETCI|nr:hypothetical protein Pcinc_043730 [Petrolisthes cinctipes]